MKIPYIYNATITRVIDGDTVEAVIDCGFGVRITHHLRLLRINCAELRSADPLQKALAQDAKEFVNELLLGKRVKIETSKDDCFGRYLAEVYIDEANVSDMLLAKSLAVPFVKKQ